MDNEHLAYAILDAEAAAKPRNRQKKRPRHAGAVPKTARKAKPVEEKAGADKADAKEDSKAAAPNPRRKACGKQVYISKTQRPSPQLQQLNLLKQKLPPRNPLMQKLMRKHQPQNPQPLKLMQKLRLKNLKKQRKANPLHQSPHSRKTCKRGCQGRKP